MLEKIKKSFRSASSKNGSYSVGMIALVICMVIVVNLIAVSYTHLTLPTT